MLTASPKFSPRFTKRVSSAKCLSAPPIKLNKENKNNIARLVEVTELKPSPKPTPASPRVSFIKNNRDPPPPHSPIGSTRRHVNRNKVAIAHTVKSRPERCRSASASRVHEMKHFECRSPWISTKKVSELRRMVEQAIELHRVFTIRGYYQPVRQALEARGWVEKCEQAVVKPGPKATSCSSADSVSMDDDGKMIELPPRNPADSPLSYNGKCEKLIVTKLLQNVNVDLLWSYRRCKSDSPTERTLLRNRFPRVPFTSKSGLCEALHEIHWHYIQGVSNTMFPRCYNIWEQDEHEGFVNDFRLTACMSLLKWLAHKIDTKCTKSICCPNGEIPFSCIHFAMKRCDEFIDFNTNADLDCKYIPPVMNQDWNTFLKHQRLLVHKNAVFREDANCSLQKLCMGIKQILEEMQKHWHQMDIDGINNIWIMKPGNKCRGRGIVLVNDINDVIATALQAKDGTQCRYVVQKYIEKPFTIYHTKFDIRQWFLVTSIQPLTVWMYRDSYLRFSSQRYNLQNYHESVHLTNNAVQKKYKNADRSNALPDENMWDCYTFQTHLRQIGKANMWEEKIYPGMRESIVGALLSSQDSMDRRNNTFELFGADFMLGEDFTPWLIEINASPDMAPTTSVTARMCPQCLEDVIKVIIDRREDCKADTGMFQCIFMQRIPRVTAYLGLTLQVRGKRIFKRNKKMSRRNSVNATCPKNRSEVPLKFLRDGKTMISEGTEEYDGPVISNLMEYVNIKLSDDKGDAGDGDSAIGFSFNDPVIKKSKARRRNRVLANANTTNSSVTVTKIYSNNDKRNSLCRKLTKAIERREEVKENNRCFTYDITRRHHECCFKPPEDEYKYINNISDQIKSNSKGGGTFKCVGSKYVVDAGVWERDTASILKANAALIKMTPSSSDSYLCHKRVKLNQSKISMSGSGLLSKISPKCNSIAMKRDSCSSLLAVGLSLKSLRSRYFKLKQKEIKCFGTDVAKT